MEIDIQKITLDGKNYVLLSEEDFEDLIDGMKAQAVLARVQAGEETWPSELVYELWETDSRIRTFRKYRGMTMTELATAAEFRSRICRISRTVRRRVLSMC